MNKNEVKFTRKKKKTAGANDRLRNILNFLYMLLIQDNGTLDYYAEKLNCKPSTVKKYIEDIRSTYDPVNNTSFSIEYNKSTNHYELFNDLAYIRFSQEEIEKLHMAASYLAIQKGTPFEEINKLEDKLKKFSLVKEEDLLHKSVLISAPEVRSELKKWLKIIDDAIYSRKKLEIKYIKTESTEEEIKEIVPYSLLIYDYEWLVRAFCLKSGIFKTYAINQITGATIKKLTAKEKKGLPEKGEKQAQHNWDWGNKEPVTVSLKFKKNTAEGRRKKYTYRKEHPSQVLEEDNDFLIVIYKVKNIDNMVEWIMKFGSSVEVLEPEVLKEKIRGEIEKMKAIYSK